MLFVDVSVLCSLKHVVCYHTYLVNLIRFVAFILFL